MQNLVNDPNPNPNYMSPRTGSVAANFLKDAAGAPIPVQHGDMAEVYSEINRAEELKRAQQQQNETPTSTWAKTSTAPSA